jgi:hypothetical protein
MRLQADVNEQQSLTLEVLQPRYEELFPMKDAWVDVARCKKCKNNAKKKQNNKLIVRRKTQDWSTAPCLTPVTVMTKSSGRTDVSGVIGDSPGIRAIPIMNKK